MKSEHQVAESRSTKRGSEFLGPFVPIMNADLLDQFGQGGELGTALVFALLRSGAEILFHFAPPFTGVAAMPASLQRAFQALWARSRRV